MKNTIKVTIRVDKETKRALEKLKELGEIGSYSEGVRRAINSMLYELVKKYPK